MTHLRIGDAGIRRDGVLEVPAHVLTSVLRVSGESWPEVVGDIRYGLILCHRQCQAKGNVNEQSEEEGHVLHVG